METSKIENIATTVYLVEASSFEQQCLWEKWIKNYELVAEKNWVQINPGYSQKVGSIDDRPIVLSYNWVRINGILICFYEATSQLVDWVMIEKWLTDTFPAFKEGRKTDANNFHFCWHYIELMNIKDK